MADSDDEKRPVGYGNPPKETQFKPGQSGNPAGRPKGSRNVKNILLDVLSEDVTISENGQQMVVSKHEAWVRRLVAKAIGGDNQSTKNLIEILKKYSGMFTR